MAFDDIAKRMQKRDAFVLSPRRRLLDEVANPDPSISDRNPIGAYVLMSLGILFVLAGGLALLLALAGAPVGVARLLVFGIALGVALIKRAWRTLPDGHPNQ